MEVKRVVINKTGVKNGADVRTLLQDAVGDIKNHEYFMILRKRSKISQNELFLRSEINPQIVSEFECGKRDLPDEDIIKLVKSLKN